MQTLRASLIVAGWLAISFQTQAVEASAYSLCWITNSNQTTVEVVGLDEKSLRQLQEANWHAAYRQ